MEKKWQTLWEKYGLIALVLLGTLLWSLPAILNHFPLFYSDSTYYVDWILRPNQPNSVSLRPRTYSYLILWPSLKNFGFLAPIILQNFICLTLLAYCTSMVLEKHQKKTFLLFLLVAPITSLVYTANFLTPDIFSGLTFVAFALVVLSNSQIKKALLILLVLVFSLMHFSNIIVTLLLTSIYFAKAPKMRRWIVPPLLVFCIVTIRIAFFQPSFEYEKTAHLYLNSKLRVKGPAMVWLSQNCSNINNFFCQKEHHNFEIWKDINHPSVKERGGLVGLMPDIVAINQGALKSKAIFQWLTSGSYDAFKQLGAFQKPIPFQTPNFITEASIAGIGTQHLESYTNQKLISNDQNKRTIFYDLVELLVFLSTILSALALYICLKRGLLSGKLRTLAIVCFSGYILNSLVIGLLTDPNPRYNFRLAWVFPFCMVLALLPKFFASKPKKQ